LGEIEAALTTHQAVREVVVLPREDSAGSKRLVAYIVPESASPPNISEFRDFLNRTLPSYMIPAGFVFLEAFPLTFNGKINRRMLPEEDQRSSQEEGTYVAPRNSLESQLTKIWETVLGRQPIGVSDNFFNMGGESLLAVRLCSEIERALQKKIPVSLIFHAQTIEQLAKTMGQSGENESKTFMFPIQASGSNPPIFCVLFGSTFMPLMKDYPNQPLHMFYNQGHDGKPILHTTVEEIATCYLKGIRTVQPKGPYYLAGYSFGGVVVYEMAQQLRKQGETIGFLALVDPTTGRPQPTPSSWVSQVGQLLTPKTQMSNQCSTYFTILTTVIFPRALNAIQWRLKYWKNISTDTIKIMICNMFFRLDYLLPKSLRLFYRSRMVHQAARQYIHQYYPGQIVIFQTSKNVENYWSKICAEVLQVYDYPTGHLDLVDGPHTQTLLHELMNCLEKAQRNLE
jgi:thioesterase domain-containing protein/acyl carrier protein